jgi:hypothetical protein
MSSVACNRIGTCLFPLPCFSCILKFLLLVPQDIELSWDSGYSWEVEFLGIKLLIAHLCFLLGSYTLLPSAFSQSTFKVPALPTQSTRTIGPAQTKCKATAVTGSVREAENDGARSRNGVLLLEPLWLPPLSQSRRRLHFRLQLQCVPILQVYSMSTCHPSGFGQSHTGFSGLTVF